MASWGDWASGLVTSLSSALGYENLEVVNPSGEKSEQPADQRRTDLFSKLKQYLGKDVMSMVSVPVWFMEPFTTLQKMAEIMEHSEYLDLACDTQDPAMRAAYVAAFSVSMYGCLERTWKPFNPILGETFEFVAADKGYAWMSEQVSHHPPIGAGCADHPRWRYEIISAPETKFLGNSIEIYPIGRTRIILKEFDNEEYYIVPPPTKANNIVVGGMWLDTFGVLTIGCASGYKNVMDFTQCGWLGTGRYEFSGYTLDPQGKKKIKLFGRWNTHLDCVLCDEEGEPLPGAEVKRLWTCKEKTNPGKYGFTDFAHQLNSFQGHDVLPTDSRLRTDRLALEKGDSATAQRAKYELEERQRAERRERAARGDKWEPQYFEKRTEGFSVYEGERPADKLPTWVWKGPSSYAPKTVEVGAEPVAPEFRPWQYPGLAVASLGEQEDPNTPHLEEGNDDDDTK